MRVLVSGATGFVGRWLSAELAAGGHEVIGFPSSRELDIVDESATAAFVTAAEPDALVHLAAISYAPDAARDPGLAMRVNEAGTASVVSAAGRLGRPIRLLVAGSSEVYGHPDPADLPLAESAPLRPAAAYGRSKLAQERIALRLAAEHGLPVIVTRSFNHTGPGQRSSFVAPALASRILNAVRSGAPSIRVGNLDVRRDLGDVRDVVRAYRLLLELSGIGPAEGLIVNVCTGRSVSIRHVVETLCELGGAELGFVVDPELVRANDPPEIVGSRTRLSALTSWQPTIPLRQTLGDLLASARGAPA